VNASRRDISRDEAVANENWREEQRRARSINVVRAGHLAYHAVADWIAEDGCEIAEPPREVYLNDPRTVRPEKLLTRVEFPV